MHGRQEGIGLLRANVDHAVHLSALQQVGQGRTQSSTRRSLPADLFIRRMSNAYRSNRPPEPFQIICASVSVLSDDDARTDLLDRLPGLRVDLQDPRTKEPLAVHLDFHLVTARNRLTDAASTAQVGLDQIPQ